MLCAAIAFILCAGRDVIAQAQSGTGKTATFSVGVLQRLNLQYRECQALILSPTRELAMQVKCTHSVSYKGTRHVGKVYSFCLLPGNSLCR